MTSKAMSSVKINRFYCGELCERTLSDEESQYLLSSPQKDFEPNVKFDFMAFVPDPSLLPARIVDLLYIAGYVFSADRAINRGERKSVDNKSWARSFEMHIPVYDYDFWNNKKICGALDAALKFMTGDRKYNFVFEPATGKPFDNEEIQTSLFGNGGVTLQESELTDIMLFSGGLDSLAGTIERLNVYPERKLCLISHQSNTVTMHTQKYLIDSLRKKYSSEITSYGFTCHNRSINSSREETQRTRMFLFSAIAYAICSCYNKSEFYVYENGMTSINLPKQGDVFNARASRTTHPKTLGLLQNLFRLFPDTSSFKIIAPYCELTKEEVVRIFEKYNEKDLISSSVSCSSTRTKASAPHCGICSQCIDRRFALFAAGLDEYDAIYAEDFIKHMPNDEVKNRLYNTLRLAASETAQSPDELFNAYPEEIMNLMNFWKGDNPADKQVEIYQMFCRYGDSILKAAEIMRHRNENLRLPYDQNSFLSLLAHRTYLETAASCRIREIDKLLATAIPVTFSRSVPISENDLNDKIQGILINHGRFTREYPVLKFGISSYIADHAENGIIIEAKFIRQNTPPSKAGEGIAADITKIPDNAAGILFAVYDPYGEIKNVNEYCEAFRNKRTDCYVKVYR